MAGFEMKQIYQGEFTLWVGITGSFDVTVQTEETEESLADVIDMAVIENSPENPSHDIFSGPRKLGKYRVTIERQED